MTSWNIENARAFPQYRSSSKMFIYFSFQSGCSSCTIRQWKNSLFHIECARRGKLEKPGCKFIRSRLIKTEGLLRKLRCTLRRTFGMLIASMLIRARLNRLIGSGFLIRARAPEGETLTRRRRLNRFLHSMI